jgi:hypothetical protein
MTADPTITPEGVEKLVERCVEPSITSPMGSAQPVTAWRPIETFRYRPGSSGPVALIVARGETVVAEYVPEVSSRSPGYWRTVPGGWPRYAPTHWMPLPEPPAAVLSPSGGSTQPTNSQEKGRWSPSSQKHRARRCDGEA